ncbi:MAG: hypothetical protein ABI675_03415 [Chitinophagaceae bacterium]
MKTVLVFNFVWIFSFAVVGQDQAKLKPEIWGVTVSLPYMNSYKYFDYDVNKGATKSGFGGLGLALFYKSGRNKVSLNYGLTADLPAPVGPIDFGHEGTRSQIGSRIVDFIYHRNIFKKVYVISGINLTKYKYNFLSYVDTIPSYNKHDNSFGLLMGAEYVFEKTFSMAALYRPAISSQDVRKYKHLLTLDFRFDINIRKK